MTKLQAKKCPLKGLVLYMLESASKTDVCRETIKSGDGDSLRCKLAEQVLNPSLTLRRWQAAVAESFDPKSLSGPCQFSQSTVRRFEAVHKELSQG